MPPDKFDELAAYEGSVIAERTKGERLRNAGTEAGHPGKRRHDSLCGRIGVERPCLVVVPCGVWHGVKNLSSEPAVMLNAVDEAYAYEQPDHWRLPMANPHIPFDFGTTS